MSTRNKQLSVHDTELFYLLHHLLVGLVVKASASREEDPVFAEIFHTSNLKIDAPVANLPGAWRDRVSAGTGPPGVSDWVRWKVGSATSISVWQHVQLSKQIRPWDTFACCWDAKQPTNKTNLLHHRRWRWHGSTSRPWWFSQWGQGLEKRSRK